jgi:hypothetical protein
MQIDDRKIDKKGFNVIEISPHMKDVKERKMYTQSGDADPV